MGKKCLKCGYERQASDIIIPDYECPKCGAVYAKVEAALGIGKPLPNGNLTETQTVVQNTGFWSRFALTLRKLVKIAGAVIICICVLFLSSAILMSLDPHPHPHASLPTPIIFICCIISLSLILGGTFMWGRDRRKFVFGIALVANSGFLALIIFSQLVTPTSLRDSLITLVFLCIMSLIAGITLITF